MFAFDDEQVCRNHYVSQNYNYYIEEMLHTKVPCIKKSNLIKTFVVTTVVSASVLVCAQ
jgi:hypothetical protein